MWDAFIERLMGIPKRRIKSENWRLNESVLPARCLSATLGKRRCSFLEIVDPSRSR